MAFEEERMRSLSPGRRAQLARELGLGKPVRGNGVGEFGGPGPSRLAKLGCQMGVGSRKR